MSKFNKFFGFWLCIIMIGGILSFGGNRVFADITLSKEESSIPDKPTIVIKFDDKMDILNLNMALHDVIGPLKNHSCNALCPYEMVRMMFINSFEMATVNCFKGNSEAIIKELCGIFADILLKDSLENSEKNKTIASCGPMQVVFLNYKELAKIADERMADVVKDAYSGDVSELKAAYVGGYRLVIG